MNQEVKVSSEERTEKLEGIGCKRKRQEDIRFTQGAGNFVDDVKMPGMLFGDFVRSPYAHARITKIDKESALAVDGVLAVITAEDLIPLNLHYMPTLAHEKVLFQNQEVAFIVAKDRYAADDGVEALVVEYEELEPLVDPFKSMADDAVILREDIQDKTEGAHGPRVHPNHIFTWDAGDEDATAKAFENADVVVKEYLDHPRVHPCPLETCASVAHMDKITGQLTLYGTFQAPHVVRTVASLISDIPEHKIRVIAPDIGGGFGNKVGVYPGYVLSIVATIVTGKPVKWVEDRIENLSATAFARDYHITAELAATKPYWLGQQIAVIGAGTLAGLYVTALGAQAAPATQVNADRATLAGLTAAYRSWKDQT